MNQKRFLTADEVFQLFGVDADALSELVDSGAVTALKDLGSFKYRAEDFAVLVQAGKLTPRTAGEMFQVDAKGELPFLKVKQDDQTSKFDNDISFIELDEEALDEQAQLSRPAQTPIVPEKWFDDSDDSVELMNTSKASEGASGDDSDDDETDFDFDITAASEAKKGSDSNVRLVEEDTEGIDLDEPDDVTSASDSDVRLEGPVSSPISPYAGHRKKKSGSDSDVRLSKAQPTNPPSDSDVTIANPAVKPDSDSDVTLAMPGSPVSSSVTPTADERGGGTSDSDVVLVASPGEAGADSKTAFSSAEKPASDSDVVLVAPVADSSPLKPDSDSDVRIALSAADSDSLHSSPRKAVEQVSSSNSLESIVKPKSSESDILTDFDQTVIGAHDSGIRFKSGDSGITLEHVDLDMLEDATPGNSGIRLESASDSGVTFEKPVVKLDTSKTEAEIPVTNDSGLTDLSPVPDSGITLDTGGIDSGIALESATTDGEIAIHQYDDDSGLAMVPAEPDSGITLDTGGIDSGIALESATTDSEIAIHQYDDDSGLAMVPAEPDSGITLDTGADSGIALESSTTDSEITIHHDGDDSGLALDADGIDSRIKLQSGRTDSEIAIAPDSGISLEDSAIDSGLSLQPKKTDSEIDSGVLQGDSGINLGFDFLDSGLSLEGESAVSKVKFDSADSGIRLSEAADSGLTFEDQDPSATLPEIDSSKFAAARDSSLTQTLDLSNELMGATEAHSTDSIGDQTIEMTFDDGDEDSSDTSATVVNKGRNKSLSLSEAFKLDEPLEVEDLDISEDLDSAVESEYSEEFEEAEEEVLEASDDDFSGGELEAAEDFDDEVSEASAPVVKVRAAPKEPSWGLLAVVPIGMASMAMAATVLILWGGVATMWTGAEAPGPAAALISALAGLI